MKFITSFTVYFALFTITYIVSTDARRSEVLGSNINECKGENRNKAECQNIQNEVSCGEHRLEPYAELAISSKFARKLRNKQSCKWKFETDEDVSLHITCQILVGKDSGCRLNNIVISDGNFKKSKLCGGERTASFISESGVMNVASRIDRIRRSSTNFRCTVGAYPRQATVTPPLNTPPPPGVDPFVLNTCRCGRPNRDSRIVGGDQVTPHQYPWQVALIDVDNRRPFCGGSIISDSWILTAAHCLFRKRVENIRVLVGEHDWTLTNDTKVTKMMKAKHMTYHYGFFFMQPLNNDIGLIQLETPLEFPEDNSIAPVCLPPPNRSYNDVDAVVIGWGTTENKFSGVSKFLRATEVKTITNDVCQSIVTIKGRISENMICAGFLFGGENACHGDSGGPLVTRGEGCGGNCMVHIGIVSWGAFCNLGVLPTVYTRTNRYLDWIRMYTRGSKTCQVES